MVKNRVRILYDPDWSDSHKKFTNNHLAHLEIESENREQLPIIETNYCSHFTLSADIEAYRTPIEFVRKWLNEKAKSKEWETYKKLTTNNTTFTILIRFFLSSEAVSKQT